MRVSSTRTAPMACASADTRVQPLDTALLRTIVLEQSRRAGVGHIGSALSIVDIVATLYGCILQIESPEHPERDRFILSKGHAALALYAALYMKGWLSLKELNTFCTDGSRLGVNPTKILPGVDFSTGSLGQGLPFALGAALAASRQKSDRTIYVLMSDAELNEGSVWEAAMFAAHHKMGNIIAIVDLNRQQAFGYTKDVIALTNLAQRWGTFGWDVAEIDGHNPEIIADTIYKLKRDRFTPHIILADTQFGKGVSFMEGQISWHYKPMSEREFALAMAEVQSRK